MPRVLYSGCFDLLHMGHVGALQSAKNPGDTLIVHVASDKEIRAVKGALRPIVPGSERAELIKHLSFVDEVYYEEKFLSEEDVIKITKADIMVRNDGSTATYGITVRYVPRFVPESGLDTTGIIRKIQSGEDQKKISGINYILIAGDEILLQRRDDKPEIKCPNGLVFPGGAIDEDDAPNATVREVREETGLEVKLDELVFLTDFTYPWGETNRFFVVRRDVKPEIKSNEGKMEWHNVKALPELCANQNYVADLL